MVPALTSESCSAGELRWTFVVPPGLPFFRGHFPEHPILPGVVALSWLLAAAERWSGHRRRAGPWELLNVKFQAVIEPGAEVELTLTAKSGGYLQGRVRSEAGVHATVLLPLAKG